MESDVLSSPKSAPNPQIPFIEVTPCGIFDGLDNWTEIQATSGPKPAKRDSEKPKNRIPVIFHPFIITDGTMLTTKSLRTLLEGRHPLSGIKKDDRCLTSRDF
jgi:hypothetical protein